MTQVMIGVFFRLGGNRAPGFTGSPTTWLDSEHALRQTNDMATQAIIILDPEIMSGQPVFAGTRVLFQTLLDYIEGGDTLDEFLDDFPGVTREMAVSALESAKESLLAQIA